MLALNVDLFHLNLSLLPSLHWMTVLAFSQIWNDVHITLITVMCMQSASASDAAATCAAAPGPVAACWPGPWLRDAAATRDSALDR